MGTAVSNDKIAVGKTETVPMPAKQTPEVYQQIRNLYYKMTGKYPDGWKGGKGFYDKLKKALSDGKITRDELMDIFDDQHISKAAWNAFTGDKKAISVDDLKKCMEHYVKFQNLTGIPWSYWSQCDKIVRVSREELAKALSSMSQAQLVKLCTEHKELIREMLQYLDPETDYRKLSAKELADNLRGLDKGKKQWVALGLFYKFYESLKKDDVDLTKLLKEPIVAKEFRSNLFKKYLLDTQGVTSGHLRAFKARAEKIKKLASIVGHDNKLLLNADFSSKEFNAVLDEMEKGASGKRLEELLRKTPEEKNPDIKGAPAALTPEALALKLKLNSKDPQN